MIPLCQLFPGMEWIPIICIAGYLFVIPLTMLLAWFVARHLPVGKLSPRQQTVARWSAAVLVVATPCMLCFVTRGPSIKQCEQVSVGMATDDVQALLGRPSQRTIFDNGEETWVYHYAEDLTGLGYFAVRFDPLGQVIHTWLE